MGFGLGLRVGFVLETKRLASRPQDAVALGQAPEMLY
jgi:hypothetical protein